MKTMNACERAIFAEKNNDVNAINSIIEEQILGKYTTYKSIDTIMNMDEIVIYLIEIHWTFQEYRNVNKNWYAHNSSSQHQYPSNLQWNLTYC